MVAVYHQQFILFVANDAAKAFVFAQYICDDFFLRQVLNVIAAPTIIVISYWHVQINRVNVGRVLVIDEY